jgi:tetratricopeptide (TPR) repeat protein
MRGDLLEAQKLCCKAVKLSPRSPIILVNCGRIWLAQGCRKEARDLFTKAYSIDNTNSAAALELSGMGVRRPPVFGSLGRSHPLNCFLGRLRHRLLGFRRPGLKKR